MFAKLKNEKLGAKASSTTSKTNEADDDVRSRSDVDSPTDDGSPETNSTSEMWNGGDRDRVPNAKDVVFLQTKLNELLARMKGLKKEKEKVEAEWKADTVKTQERIDGLVAEHQTKQDQMQESFRLSLRQKEMEKLDLQTRLDESEKIRDKIQKRDEESDELKDFQNQELAKVKHMLINAQNQVSSLQEKLRSSSETLDRESARASEMERRLRQADETLQLKVAQLRSLEEKNADDTATFTSTLKDMRTEKATMLRQLQKSGEQLQQKVTAYSALEEKFADIEENYARDKRAAEIYKQETETEKIALNDQVKQLGEKVTTLEDRLGNSSLSDDERLKALEKERTTLEHRLDESREQLTEIKSSWSSKIAALENQITHLNMKQVEDNQELADKDEELDRLSAQFETKLEDYRSQLRDLEHRLTVDVASADEAKFKAESLLSDALKERDAAVGARENADADRVVALADVTSLREECASSALRVRELEDLLTAQESRALELELLVQEREQTLRETREELETNVSSLTSEKTSLEAKCRESKEKYEKDVIVVREDFYRQASDHEKVVETLESSLKHARLEKGALEEALRRSEEELVRTKDRAKVEEENWNADKESMSSLMASLQRQLDDGVSATSSSDLSSKLAAAEEDLSQLRILHNALVTETGKERKEKDDLLLRNAELSQVTTALRAELAATKEEREGTATSTSTSDLKAEVAASEDGALAKLTEDLRSQLTEKNKTIKMQQQRIADLKKTLQRELKMQSGVNGLTTSQGYSSNGGSSTEDLTNISDPALPSTSTPQPSCLRVASSSSPSLSSVPLPSPSVVPCSISNGSSDIAVLPRGNDYSDPDFAAHSLHPLLPLNDSPFIPSAGSSDVDDVIFPSGTSQKGEPHVVSFRYLKHVIIRFMISNEQEAQHLVKAVSTLLRFDREEEKLVTDHLTYRTSWFGSKPSTKKLKSARVKDSR